MNIEIPDQLASALLNLRAPQGGTPAAEPTTAILELLTGLTATKSAPPFIHLVFFWFAESAPADVYERMAADCQKLLIAIPGVTRLHWGKPAMTPRPVVDNSYNFGLFVQYANRADHDAYQVHPDHVRFSATYKPFWKKVQVFDFA